MAKFEGKDGRWITTKTGRHVFIENGKTVQEALGDAFEEFNYDPDDEFDIEPPDEDDILDVHWEIYNFKKERRKPEKIEPRDESHKLLIDGFKGKLKYGREDRQRGLRENFIHQVNESEIHDKKLVSIMGPYLKQSDSVKQIRIRGEFRRGGTYYSRYRRGIYMNIDEDNPAITMSNLIHEAGHALDHKKNDGSYLSSTYVSKKYNSNLTDMIKNELFSMDVKVFEDEYSRLLSKKDEFYNQYKAGEIDLNTKRKEQKWLDQAASSIADVAQFVFGDDVCKETFGYLPHQRGYFNEKYFYGNGGTEFFAEMCDDLINDKNHNFSKFMKRVAPDSVDIFNKILKEEYGYGK